jgi:hypothetical protein
MYGKNRETLRAYGKPKPHKKRKRRFLSPVSGLGVDLELPEGVPVHGPPLGAQLLSMPVDTAASAILMNLHDEPVLSRVGALAFYLAGSAKFMAQTDLIFLEADVETCRAFRREASPSQGTVSLLSSAAKAVLHERETAWFHNAKDLADDFLRVTTTIDPITRKNQVELVGVQSL